MRFAFNGRATRNFLGLLFLMYFVLFLDRINLAAAATTIQKDLGLSNIALGIAFSAFNYSYAPFQMVGGWFADRFGARRTLTACGLAWSVTTIATAAVTGLASLFSARLVLGMGEGATLPASIRALCNWIPLASRGTAVGVIHAAAQIGAAVTAPVVAFLIIWFSWRFAFVALGCVSALWTVVWWWRFHEDPRRHPAITSAELAALPAADPTAQHGSGPVPWRRLIPRVMPLWICHFCQAWTGFLFANWMPSLLQKNYGFDLKKSAFLYMAMLCCAMIAQFLGGVLTDYLLHRTQNLDIARSRMIAGSWALAVMALVLAILVHDPIVGIAGFTLALFFIQLGDPALWTVTMDIAPAYAGSASALLNSATVAGIMSPVVFAWLLQRTGSWTLPFAVSVGLLVFAIVVTFWIRPDRQIEVVPSVGGLAVAGE